MNCHRSSVLLVLLLLAALPCCKTSSTAAPAHDSAAPLVANRDKHGPTDVDDYIHKLESPERVADLAVDKVLDKLHLSADAAVGDLGCGPGVFSLAFAKACPRGVVFAADVEPAQLDHVNRRIAAEGLHNIVPVLATYDDPRFPPARLDLVFIADTYHHLEDRVAYMRRLQNVLAPNGRLAILEYKPGKLAVGPPPEHKLPAGVMEKELVEAGYVRVEQFDTHPDHDFEVWRVVQPWEKRH
jgi:SAM-dependent methyltransferase